MLKKKKKGIDRLEVISDDLIDRVLMAYQEYYTVIAWEILLVPKKEKENANYETYILGRSSFSEY